MHRIGIDLGGTKTEGILLDPSGRELFRKRVPTRRELGYETISEDLTALVREVASGRSLSECTIGIGIPGIINGDGLVINANTTCLIGHSFQSDIANRLNHPVAMENDANCFTLAEATEGAGKDFDFVFGVILGTGCGGGISIGRKVRRGPNGIAGEWGHVSVDPNGSMCYSGIIGCVESLISGSGAEARFKEKTGRTMKLGEISDAAKANDAECTEQMQAFYANFGRCLAIIMNVLDPDIIVIGGGVSNIEGLYTRGIEELRKFVFHKNPKINVVKNKLGDSAGVLGAAWIGI